MPTLNEIKYADLVAQTGLEGHTLDENEYQWLLNNCGGSPHKTINELWLCVLSSRGYTTGTLNERQMAWLGDLGYEGTWNERFYQFWEDGGSLGPSVRISTIAPGQCTYEPPGTVECAAVGVYEAITSGFTNPAGPFTYLWEKVSGPGIISSPIDEQTLQLDTLDDVDTVTVLKVTVTEAVAVEQAEREATITQTHTDSNVAPAFIGPPIASTTITEGVPISVDLSPRFAGTNLVFGSVNTPPGLTMNPSTGVLSGTPTNPGHYSPREINARNSKGVAYSNMFATTVEADGVASLEVVQDVAASCSYSAPAASCTATGTYSAVPTGYVPDTWFWEILSGPGAIISGQGTATVQVADTGGANVFFTLQCTASNIGESKSNFQQFTFTHTDTTVAPVFDGPDITLPAWITGTPITPIDAGALFSGYITGWALAGTWPTGISVNGSGVISGTPTNSGTFTNLTVVASNYVGSTPSNIMSVTVSAGAVLPAFHALTPDPDTYEMLGVKTGTGGLTTTHTATLYAPDFEGVQRAFAANEPVWTGGRVVWNLLRESNMLSGSVWTLNSPNVAVASGVTDPDGGSDAFTITANSGGAYLRQTAAQTGVFEGKGVLASYWLRRRTGTGTVKIYTGLDSTTVDITAQLDGTWKRFVGPYTVPNGGNNDRFGIEFGTSGDEVDACWFQGEPVPSGTTIPGEYVDNPKNDDIGTVKVFANENGNTVTSNVVTEAVGAPLAEVPYLQYYPAATNSHTYSNDLTNGVWTATTMTVAKDAVGIDGVPNSACTLTATGANSTVIGAAITAASANQATCWFLKRKTGTGTIELTVDGGTTWQSVTLTSDYQKFTIDQAAVTNPQIGIRIVTSGDAVYVGNAECHIAKTIDQVRGLGPIFTTTAAVATDAIIYKFDIDNADYSASAYYFDHTISIDPGETAWGSGNRPLMSFDASDLNRPLYLSAIRGYLWRTDEITDLTTLTDVIDANELMQIGVVLFLADTSQIGNVNGTYVDEELDYDGRTLAAQWQIFGRSGTTGGCAAQLREIQRYDINSYTEGKDIIDGLMGA